MAAIGGSGSGARVRGHDGPGLTEDRVREIISEEVVSFVPELVRPYKATMMEDFDDRCATVFEDAIFAATTVVTVVRVRGERAF